MDILYLLVPISVILVFAIGIVFWWSVRSGQFDDLEGPSYRILMDDDRAKPSRAERKCPPGGVADDNQTNTR